MTLHMPFAAALLAALAVFITPAAPARDTPIKFQLD